MNKVIPAPSKKIVEVRDKIVAFETELAKHPEAFFGDTDNMPLRHSFADGCYVREIFIPKGMIYVGKIHKFSHPRFLLAGTLLVCTESGGAEYMRAPSYMITPAGTKRIGVALEDTIIVTVHVTDETDIDKIEDYVIARNYEEITGLIEGNML